MNKNQQNSLETQGDVQQCVTMQDDLRRGSSISGLDSPSRGEGAVGQNVGNRYRYLDSSGEHLHTLDGRPLIGTSTACGVLNKPLTWWAAGMALAPLGWLNKNKSKVAEREQAASEALETIVTLTGKEWADKLEECYRAHNTKKETTAVAGTDMHFLLEGYIKECIYNNAGDPLSSDVPDDVSCGSPEVIRFHEWAVLNVAEFLWAEGHCYSEKLWTGGICDCVALLRGGRRLAVIDFKSSKEAYFSHFVQAGGYALQIEENGLVYADGSLVQAGGRRLFTDLIVFPFGGDCGPQSISNVEHYKTAFRAAVCLHKLNAQFEESKPPKYGQRAKRRKP